MANDTDKPKNYYEEYFKTGIPYFEVKYIGKDIITRRDTGKPGLPHDYVFMGYEGLKNVGSRAKPILIKDPDFVLVVDCMTLMAKIPKTKANLKLALEGSEYKEA